VQANADGCSQSLFVYDEDEWVTEAGTMNIFFLLKTEAGERQLWTPTLDDGCILPGITRLTTIEVRLGAVVHTATAVSPQPTTRRAECAPRVLHFLRWRANGGSVKWWRSASRAGEALGHHKSSLFDMVLTWDHLGTVPEALEGGKPRNRETYLRALSPWGYIG
jgi:hypothetical protein